MKIRKLIFLIILLFSISSYSQVKNFEEIENAAEIPASDKLYLTQDA